MSDSDRPTPNAATRALLAGLFDYAGLFPPAALGLDAALAQWRRHREQHESWMLGAFVLPVRLLPDLAERLAPHEAIGLSLLPTGGDTAGAWLDALHADLRAVDAFRDAAPDCAVAAFEARIPQDAQGDAAPEFVRRATGLIDDFTHGSATLFLETGWSAGAVDAFSDTLGALADGNAASGSNSERIALAAKLRMGGTTADAFPSPAAAARALAALREADVPFKCTAGLHHPVRAHHPSVGTEMHGFANVFAAAAFAHAHGIDAATLERVLATTNASAFALTDDALVWCTDSGSLSASAAQVRAARRWAQGIGSCSFDEPVDDLRALGVL
jgi:hypothetical protein